MLVSIIIPVYNREKLIVETLNSVMEQSWRPVEIIVVDDGSTDATATVVENFAKTTEDAEVQLRILRQPSRGSSKARNAGIEAASGDCLLFLDSDDVLTRDGLASLANTMIDDVSLDFTYGKVVIGDENLQSTGNTVGAITEGFLEDPVTYNWHTMAALYRSSIVTACGGWDETTNGFDDWVFQSRIKSVARKVQFVNIEIGIWRQHEGERLGTNSFRENYIVDLTKSCLAIYRQWSATGRLTKIIQRKLYFRALRYYWELGVFGSQTERNAAFPRVREIGKDYISLSLLSLLLERLPVRTDHFFYLLSNWIRPKLENFNHTWYCHQLGSREHYHIPRALHATGRLALLQTDCWVTPLLGIVAKRFRQPALTYRYHSDLKHANVRAFTIQRLLLDMYVEVKRMKDWDIVLRRNEWFQANAERVLRKIDETNRCNVVFSYSYTARRLFQWAKKKGHLCILGQIDPGPEELRWVRQQTTESCNSEPEQSSEPPSEYWESWKQEVELADCILVNSEWSKKLLEREGVCPEKLKIVPLAFERSITQRNCLPKSYPKTFTLQRPLKALFLGQVIRRKGVIPLLEAVDQLVSEPIEFTFAGPDPRNLLKTYKKRAMFRSLGSVDKGTVEKLYKEADVFILPTFSDGFAITQLEAAAYRLPLIVSEYCGNVVESGKNGWILKEVSAACIAEALRECLSNPAMLTGFSGYELDWERFSLKSLARSLEEAEMQAHTNSQ